jgi:hypothetical protein
MDTNGINQYPAALYSAVSEIGYRSERFTGEIVRSGTRRRSRLAGIKARTRSARVQTGSTGNGMVGSADDSGVAPRRRHVHRHVAAH